MRVWDGAAKSQASPDLWWRSKHLQKGSHSMKKLLEGCYPITISSSRLIFLQRSGLAWLFYRWIKLFLIGREDKNRFRDMFRRMNFSPKDFPVPLLASSYNPGQNSNPPRSSPRGVLYRSFLPFHLLSFLSSFCPFFQLVHICRSWPTCFESLLQYVNSQSFYRDYLLRIGRTFPGNLTVTWS